MPTTNSNFDLHTTGQNVVAAFADQVKDKTVLITGANPSGIGNSTAVALAGGKPKLLILAGRDAAKLSKTEENVKAVDSTVTCKTLILDLSSLKSCQEAAQKVLDDQEISHIDILVNNAGVMNIVDRQLTVDGIEMQFATNHVGHFFFTNLLLSKLVTAARKAPPLATRVINLSSRAVVYGPVRFSDYNFDKNEAEIPEDERMSDAIRQFWGVTEAKPYTAQAAYGQSKSANVLFSVALNKRLNDKGILSVAVHPGLIGTNLGRYMDQEELKAALKKAAEGGAYMKNLEEGCSSTLVAALDPKLGPEDLFFEDCQTAGWAPAYCTDTEKAEKLWTLSEQLVKKQFKY